MFWKIYKSSKLATFVSIIGACFAYGGIICLVSGVILAGIICIAVGVGFYLAAEKLASNAVFKAWKKQVVSKGYAQRIAQGEYSVAAQLYNQNPGEKTLQYFETLNPDVASRLRGAAQTGSAQKAVPAENQNTSSTPRPVQAAAKPAAPVKSAERTGHSAQPRRCAACGAGLAADSHFCTQCGSKVERIRKCLRCGNKLSDGAKFCEACGYQI